MSMNDFFKQKTQEETEFYKFAKTAFDKQDIEMKTDINFSMLYSAMHVYIEYVEAHGFPTTLLKKLMYQYYMLQVSKNARGRNDIVEITKNSITQEQQKAQ